ncbi:MAG: cyclic nucleotide-binding domain-containing protein, partial [Okeania sp. SIO3B3]|nr:cyclic nucleotide-binding domain-containing protein [Okeania sp. SIO3B3]
MDLENVKHFESLANATQAEVDWMFENGVIVELAVGDVFHKQGTMPEYFYVVLEGELQIARTADNKTVVLGTTPVGIIGGELSLLMQTESWVDATAIVPSRLLTLTPDKFREMFAMCPNISANVFREAGQRTRNLAQFSQ